MEAKIVKKVQVVIMCKEKSNQLLILQTIDKRGAFWQNVTGKVEAKESFIKAAARELKEETGIKAKQDQLIELKYEFEFTTQKNQEVIEKCFLIILNKKPKIDLSKQKFKEHKDYKWVEIEDVSINNYKFQSSYDAFSEAKQHV